MTLPLFVCVVCTSARGTGTIGLYNFEEPWVGDFDPSEDGDECPQCGCGIGIVRLDSLASDSPERMYVASPGARIVRRSRRAMPRHPTACFVEGVARDGVVSEFVRELGGENYVGALRAGGVRVAIAIPAAVVHDQRSREALARLINNRLLVAWWCTSPPLLEAR